MHGSKSMRGPNHGNPYSNTHRQDTEQPPSHHNPSSRDRLCNAIPTDTVRPVNHKPTPATSQHQTDSEEHNIKLDLPSWPTFATHTTPDLKPTGRHSQIETAGIHRRLCFSLDEKALFDLHHRHQYSSTSASQQRSSGQSDQSPHHTAPEPIAPPYPPPKRTQTPDGVSSWPGLLPHNRETRQQQQRKGNFLQRSSRKLSRFFANILDDRHGGKNRDRARVRRIFSLKRCRDDPPMAADARWRPPISGHSTFRFDSLNAHPFSGPSLSDEPYVGEPFTGVGRRRKVFSSSLMDSQRSGLSEDLAEMLSARRVQLPRRGEAIPQLVTCRRAVSRPSRSSGSDNSVAVSPSVRALAAARGLPLPVSPEQVDVQTARRSSSIPRSRAWSPVNGLGSQRRFSYPTSTMRTLDLIEAFPEPPSPRVPRSRHSAPARMSLFPTTTVLKDHSGNVPGTSPSKMRLEMLESVVESAKKRKWASSSGPSQNVVSGTDNAGTPSASNLWVSGALPQPADHDGSADTIVHNSGSVSGKYIDRPLLLDTLVYDRNTISSGSVNETENVNTSVSMSHPDTPVSGKTGMTRYFSAASQIVPTRNLPATTAPSTSAEPQVLCRSEHQVQRERAVANGALRFSYQAPRRP